MKKILILLILIIAVSIIYQSYSFTSVQLGQEISYNIVSEEQALISIDHDKNSNSFTLTNNTENNIEITNISIDGNGQIAHESMSDPYLNAGERKEYIIEGETKQLTGAQMNISFVSKNMQIEISSTLPQFIEEENAVEKEFEAVQTNNMGDEQNNTFLKDPITEGSNEMEKH